MTSKGSISYLVTPEKSHTKTWTHILMAQQGVIFLHCLNSQLQQQFVEAENNTVQLANIKVEGFINPPSLDTATGNIPKTTELLDTLVRPNVYENVKEYLEASVRNHLCKSVTFDASRFSHHLPIMHSTAKEKGLCTSRSIEKAARWRTCFRDCEGTDRFPILYENQRPIQDLAIDVLNGIPVSSGFGVAVGLIRDLLEQLQDVILKDIIYAKEMKSTQELIAMIVTELVNGMEGSGQKLFIKGLRKEDARLVSKKLLVALYLVGKRFSKDSANHQQLCSYIHTVIEEKTHSYFQVNDVSLMQVKPDETATATALDAAWSQVNRYENMSLREREDAAHGYLPEFKSEKQQQPSIATTIAGPRHNPNFKSRRGGNHANPNANGNNSNTAPPSSSSSDPRSSSYHYNNQKRPTYPDPSNAKPYLTYIAPTLEEKAQEEEQEEKSLGNPGNLLWLYWMNDKIKKRGNQDEGDLSLGTELVYKDHQWKRVKKEFLGRLAQPGEKGETI
ncbi:CIA30 domain-containing protein [Mucor velutinosus]|uniref:CIA30 domain-containing protein n=1 Tax=Mucor velutinosus TaxID=708070 RepID=A0AAN7D9M5_9FUNG|nr:CIA30 domain-containing protein [Mucor velutinosus]